VKPDLPFKPIEPQAPAVAVRLDGEVLHLPDGMNLAAALLSAGVVVFRHSPVSGAPRGPYCMMGACFECLLDVEEGGGMTTRQACMMTVSENMVLRRRCRPES
jgi:D-hydroxyproline dehydrogenase subunit gamma